MFPIHERMERNHISNSSLSKLGDRRSTLKPDKTK